MDIVLQLNIDPTSEIGLRVQYYVTCLNQINNCYYLNPNGTSEYKDFMNSILGSMCTHILNDDIPGANTIYENNKVTVAEKKYEFFDGIEQYLLNMYSPPE